MKLAGWILIAAFAGSAAAFPQGQDGPDSKAALKEAAAPRDAARNSSQDPVRKASVQAMQVRLTDLEAEEAALSKLAQALANGETVRPADLWEAWLPGAVYGGDGPEAEPGIAGAAAEVTSDLLDQKCAELENLERMKRQVADGAPVSMDALEDLKPLGIEGRQKELTKQEEELSALQARLEDLQFQERFRRSADLKKENPGPEKDLLAARDRLKAKASSANGEVEAGSGAVPLDSFDLGDACYRAGRLAQALEVLERIDSAAHPEGDRVLYLIGRCQERLGKLEDAEKSFTLLRKTYPASFWADQAEYALSMVQWRRELGVIEGAPSEVWRILDGKPQEGDVR